MRVVSVLPERDRTAWIAAQRPARPGGLDPFKPHGFFWEEERVSSGDVVPTAVILLTNKECPWRCLMCDLWRNTLTKSVPPGAIPRQIDFALAQLGPKPEQLKLYNSGSFFDPAAIPHSDYATIADRISFVPRVVVEAHPRLVGEAALRFRDLLGGALEVAIGLETVHPEILPRLNKKFELAHFARAADFLQRAGISLRAFVLLKPPFMCEAEGLEWAIKSAAYAFSCGASVVSLVPTRAGNGAMDRLVAAGEFTRPRLATLEKALELALNLHGGRVFADTWDLEPFSACPDCFQRRRQRLHMVNLTQKRLPPVDCLACGGV